MTSPAPDHEHTAVGAYALGLLDPAEAARFEDHLLGCGRCAAELEELVALPPLLADAATGLPEPRALLDRPGPGLLDGLLDEVAGARRARRRRRLVLVAAAAALIIGGPVAAVAINGDENAGAYAGSPAKAVYEQQSEKYRAIDSTTRVEAGVSLAEKPWGTTVALRLGNVRGPRSCGLYAVGHDGAEQTVTTWAVPRGGYGVTDTTEGGQWSKEPLYALGGTAMTPEEIDHFEVRTLDGERLAAIDLPPGR